MAGKAAVPCSRTMLAKRGGNSPSDDQRNRGKTPHDDILRLFPFLGMITKETWAVSR
jgi:hypothetical protein